MLTCPLPPLPVLPQHPLQQPPRQQLQKQRRRHRDAATQTTALKTVEVGSQSCWWTAHHRKGRFYRPPGVSTQTPALPQRRAVATQATPALLRTSDTGAQTAATLTADSAVQATRSSDTSAGFYAAAWEAVVLASREGPAPRGELALPSRARPCGVEVGTQTGAGDGLRWLQKLQPAASLATAGTQTGPDSPSVMSARHPHFAATRCRVRELLRSRQGHCLAPTPSSSGPTASPPSSSCTSATTFAAGQAAALRAAASGPCSGRRQLPLPQLSWSGPPTTDAGRRHVQEQYDAYLKKLSEAAHRRLRGLPCGTQA